MQTAVAAPLDASHQPLLDPHPRPRRHAETGQRATRPLVIEPRPAAPGASRVEYLRGAGAGLVQLRAWLDRLAADPKDRDAMEATLCGFRSYAGSGAAHGFPRISEIARAGEAACASMVAGRSIPELYRLAALGVLLDSLDAWFATATAIAAAGVPAASQAAGAQAPVAARRARRPDVAGARILIVEDDPAQAGSIRTTLESAGHEARVCADPRRFAADLAAFGPELVLMDLALPGVTGYELVRSLPQATGAPAPAVLYLAAAPGEIHATLASAQAGGDDHLVQPLPPAALLAAVAGRLERHRRARQPVAHTPVTDAPSETALLQRAHAAVADSQRDPARHACWVTVELDHLWSIQECYGDTTGNQVLAAAAALLRPHLRPGDTLAPGSGPRLALLVKGLPPRQVATLLDGLRQQFAGTGHPTPAGGHFRTTFSAGIAPLAPGMTADQWREAADQALRHARAAGRDRVELIR